MSVVLPPPSAADGTWAQDVDALVQALYTKPWLPMSAAAELFPRIPAGVLEHIYQERRRRKR